MPIIVLFLFLQVPGKEPIMHEQRMGSRQECLTTISELLERFEQRRLPGRFQASCGIIGAEEPDREAAGK